MLLQLAGPDYIDDAQAALYIVGLLGRSYDRELCMLKWTTDTLIDTCLMPIYALVEQSNV